MSYQLTVASGLHNVVLPDGLRHRAGDTVVLSNDEFGQLSAAAVSSLFSAVKNLNSLALVAATPAAGYALVNGTGTIPGLTWTAPNDGQIHRVLVTGEISITVALTGGQIRVHFTTPNGVSGNGTLITGGEGPSTFNGAATGAIVQPGSTVTVSQDSAATAGAAVLWTEIWAL